MDNSPLISKESLILNNREDESFVRSTLVEQSFVTKSFAQDLIWACHWIKCTFLPSDCLRLDAMTSQALRGFVDEFSSTLSIDKVANGLCTNYST